MTDAGHTCTILISNRQDLPVDESGLAQLAVATLEGEGVDRAELSVSFVTDEEMTDLHVRFMDQPGSTDVLSFPLEDVDENGIRILGDVVIAPAYAAGNGPDLESELRLLLVHGILHLLGHDHEEDDQREEMWALQHKYSGVRAW